MELCIIQSKIYEIRGQRVMLDRDLAELYAVETRVLNQVVKRNMKRFPCDFMFQLTDREFEIWRSQIVISKSTKQGLRRNPYVFTEQGVAMLSGLLNSDVAIEVNISIMRAFVAMRRYLTGIPDPPKEISQVQQEIRELKEYIEEVFTDYNDINQDTAIQLELIHQTLAELSVKQTAKETQISRPKIGFRK